MGWISSLIEFVRTVKNGAQASDNKCSLDGNTVANAEHFAAPGDDSHPMPEDYVALLEVQRTGGKIAVGHLDPKNEQTAKLGEKRIYSRDGDGERIAQIHLKNDGEILLENPLCTVTMRPNGEVETKTPLATFIARPDGSIHGFNGLGYFQLLATGTFDVNNVTIDPLGNIVTPTSITAAVGIFNASLLIQGEEVYNHDHPAGTPPGNTGPMNPP